MGVNYERTLDIIRRRGVCPRSGDWSHMVRLETGLEGGPDVRKF